MNVEDVLPVEAVYGEVIEVKCPVYTIAGINECFYNMFGAGSRLACIALARGKIIVKINMYGIAASMKDRKKNKILHLEIDYQQ